MNAFSDIVLFAVVLAVNLFLFGAILAGGCALSLRFINDVSPRLRYIFSVFVFLLAVLIPCALTLNIPFGQRAILNALIEIKPFEQVTESLNQGDAHLKSLQPQDLHQLPENSSVNRVTDFTLFVASTPIGSIFLGLWISGIGYLLVREAIAFQQLRRVRAGWTIASDLEHKILLCPNEIPLYFDENQSPGTVGFFSPVIVLPKTFPAELSLDAQRLITQHEVAHAQWRDPLIKCLLRLMLAFFWVSPALWWIERIVSREREAAADHIAITSVSSKSTIQITKLIYADTLVAIAKQVNTFPRESKNPPLIGFGTTESELETRICRLFSSSPTTRLQIVLATVSWVVTVALMMVTPLATHSKETIHWQTKTAVLTNKSETHLVEKMGTKLPPEISGFAGTRPPAVQIPAGANLLRRKDIVHHSTTTLSSEESNEKHRARQEARALSLTAQPNKRLAELSALTGKLLPMNKLETTLSPISQGQ